MMIVMIIIFTKILAKSSKNGVKISHFFELFFGYFAKILVKMVQPEGDAKPGDRR